MGNDLLDDPERNGGRGDEMTRESENTGLDTATREQGDGHEPGPAAETWGRFRRVRLLGEGGMGRVCEAYDPHLQRRVALKVLRSSRPEAVERFLREARTQARLEHPNICPIHEVGETDHGPYIVMRLVEGLTLAEAVSGMSLEEKLVVMIDVAAAVHEAHRAGLIHRDLKPSNIMVEEREDGRRQVFVMDFGIARAAADAGDLTTEGAFLGTPAYAPPEQVRGEMSMIDRRSDVYSLGATLYSLISGSPPFTGTTSAVMMAVLNAQPTTLRPLGVPRDVDTIVMKCLEKDADQRYPSAKSLAEELQRFLDGDPIAARPVGPIMRATKWVRKNRLTATIAAVALVLVVAATAWGGYTRWRAGVREQLVRDLSAQAEAIEAEVRFSQMAPTHDIRPDRERLRRRMAQIEAEIDDLGRIAEGPGHYALGRAHLALNELDDARRHLESARGAAPADARIAQALGLAMSRQYRRELAEAQAIPAPELRSQRRDLLAESLRDPAIALMRQGRGLGQDIDAYLDALIAFHLDDFDTALEAIGQVSTPWFHEAQLLRAEILSERGQRVTGGADFEAVDALFEQAGDAFAAAQEIAPSDPRGYLLAGHVAYLQMLARELTDSGGLEYQPAGLGWAETAQLLDPDDPGPYRLRARLYHREGESRRHLRMESGPALAQALDAAREAVERSADPSAAWLEVALIQTSRAQVAKNSSVAEQREALAEVKAALDKVSESDQGYRYQNALGLYYGDLAKLLTRTGYDVAPEYEAAVTAYRHAISLTPKPYEALANLALALNAHSELVPVAAREPLLLEAVEALESALRENPQKPGPLYYYLGRQSVLLAQGCDRMSDRLNPGWADRAGEYYRAGIAAAPRLTYLYSGLGELELLRARSAWDRGEDPSESFRRAEASLIEGTRVAQEDSYCWLNLSWVSYFQGKYAVREGRSGQASLELAIRHAERSLAIRFNDRAVLCIGSAHRMLAEADYWAGRDPRPRLNNARSRFSEVLRHNPNHGTAHRGIARSWTLEARWRVESGLDPIDAFARAESWMARALEIHSLAPSVALAEARRCLHESKWRANRGETIGQLVDRGIEHADLAAAVRSGLPEGQAIRAHFQLLNQAGYDEEHALSELNHAIEKNPHLEFEWGAPSGRSAPEPRPPDIDPVGASS